MEYDNVTFMAYLSAAVVAALLTLTYIYQFFKEQKTAIFAPAAAVHTLNLLVIVAGINQPWPATHWTFFFECLHYNIWTLSAYLTLKASASNNGCSVYSAECKTKPASF